MHSFYGTMFVFLYFFPNKSRNLLITEFCYSKLAYVLKLSNLLKLKSTVFVYNKTWPRTKYLLTILAMTGKSQVSRGDPAGQGQTGEAWLKKICDEWDLPGKRRRWQLSTNKNGVGVWPNTFTWTWDESSQVNIGYGIAMSLKLRMHIVISYATVHKKVALYRLILLQLLR